MFNMETILSSFDCKLTLLEWLKKLTTALENDSLQDVQINKIGDNTAQMVLTFADGSIQASNVFELPQGATGATGPQGPKGDTGDGFNTLASMVIAAANGIASADDGFHVDTATQFKDRNGNLLASATGSYTIPIEGSPTVVCDIDEANHKINIHLDATYKNKIDRALQLPTTAPSATQLVGVGTNNAQTMVGVGDGLYVDNGSIFADIEVGLLVFDFVDTSIDDEVMHVATFFPKSRKKTLNDAILDYLGNYSIPVSGYFKAGQEYYQVFDIVDWSANYGTITFTYYNPSTKDVVEISRNNTDIDYITV